VLRSRLVTLSVGCPAGFSGQACRERRYPRNGAIGRHRYRQPTGVGGCVALPDAARECQDALYTCARGSVLPPGYVASCVAPCPPRLLPEGCLARDRRGLIDGAIWPQDGWRLDRLAAMAAARLSSPGLAPPRKKECTGDTGSPIPREARKSLAAILRCAPALRVRRRSPAAC
jgi:hypothetical protein